MMQRPADRGAAEAEDHQSTNGEPTEQQRADTINGWVIGGAAFLIIAIGLAFIGAASNIPLPEFHG